MKGSTCQFVSRLIIVTSPKSPEETWETRTVEDLAQLKRRVEHVIEFPVVDPISVAAIEGLKKDFWIDEPLIVPTIVEDIVEVEELI